MRKLAAFLFSILFFIAGVTAFNEYTEQYIRKYYGDDIGKRGDVVLNQGLVLQKMAAEKADVLMLYGSSELGTTELRQHPVNFFPKKECNVEVTIVGRGHCSSIIHLMNFMAMPQSLKAKKIAFIVSLQWFLFKDGLPLDGFKMNFSPLHFYALMRNQDVPENLKEYVARRVYFFTRGDRNYESENFFCRLFLSKKPYGKIILTVFKPFYDAMYYVLTAKDNFKSYNLIKYSLTERKVNPEHNKLDEISWKKEMVKAEAEGKELANNNEFYIENTLFNHWYSRQYQNQKNRFVHVNLLNSQEYSDLEALLRFSRANHVKPLFILMPVIGKWYDYLGLDAGQRQLFYNNVEKLVGSYGFEVAKLSEKEYEPYLMMDSEHLGWKGWLYVDEKIVSYCNKN